jgi:cytochrome c biogenesis protein CcmG/thiol:disulfide interchange protein DsbE
VKRARLALWLPLAVFAGFAAMAAFLLLRPAEREVRSAMIGKPLPEFDLPAIASSRPGLSRADMADGTPRLLNVFGSWCVPCAVEAPQLAALEREGVPIAAVAIRDSKEDVDRFLERYGNPFIRIGDDPISQVQLSLGSSGVPETFVIDGKGTITYQHVGEIRERDVPILLEEWRKAAR